MFLEVIDEFFVPESGLPVNGPIYLAKENNVTSEQTFQVVVYASDLVPPGQNIQPASLDADYCLAVAGRSVVVLHFDPHDQRINVLFTLFPDTLPEKTEAFLACLSPGDIAQSSDGTVVPVSTFLNPTLLFVETFVIIEDDDRESFHSYSTVCTTE